MIPSPGTGGVRMHLDVGGIDHQPFKVWLGDQRFQQLRPHAFVAPPAKAPVRVFPVAIVRGQIAPGGAGTQNPEHGVDKQAVVFGNPAPDTSPSGQQGFQQQPDAVGDVVAPMRRERACSGYLHTPKLTSEARLVTTPSR